MRGKRPRGHRLRNDGWGECTGGQKPPKTPPQWTGRGESDRRRNEGNKPPYKVLQIGGRFYDAGFSQAPEIGFDWAKCASKVVVIATDYPSIPFFIGDVADLFFRGRLISEIQLFRYGWKDCCTSVVAGRVPSGVTGGTGGQRGHSGLGRSVDHFARLVWKTGAGKSWPVGIGRCPGRAETGPANSRPTPPPVGVPVPGLVGCPGRTRLCMWRLVR